MYLKSLSKEISFPSKIVLLRLDLNVPMNEKREIEDETRIINSLPTIQYLLDHYTKIIIISHFGRPNGIYQKKYSLYPIYKRLKELLVGNDIYFSDKKIGTKELKRTIFNLEDKEILFLENIRFYPEEEENNIEFSKELSSLGDIYINDAFGTCHRKHSSTYGILSFIKYKCLGFLIEKELYYLKENIRPPVFAIIGGSKISTKITLLKSLLEKVDTIFIGGAMVFTFLAARGISTGKSLIEKDEIDTAKEIESYAKKKGVELVLPIDFRIVKDIKQPNTLEITMDQTIPKDWIGIDQGSLSDDLLEKKILEKKSTVLWNGPLGIFEIEEYSKGTNSLLKVLSKLPKEQNTILGGGDTLSAVKKLGFQKEDFTHLSTGGGSSLKLLEGDNLPCISIFEKK